MPANKTMGRKIKALREEKGLSLRKAAKLIDMDYSYLNRIENGFVPSIKLLEQIANAYNVELSFIVGNEIEIPDEIKPHIKKWYSFIEDATERNYSPEDILKILDTVDSIKGKSSHNSDE